MSTITTKDGTTIYYKDWGTKNGPVITFIRTLITTSILLFAFVAGVAHAKRIPAPKAEPVVYEGVRYVAPNDNGLRGYIQAWDTSTNRMLWSVTVFRNFINPLLEEDVQWIYVRKLRVEDGKLIVVDEKDRAYSVDLKTHGVRELRKFPSKKPQATGADSKAVAVQADMAEKADIEQLFAETKKVFGRLDILVNNADKENINHPLRKQRHAWVQLIKGDLDLNGSTLSAGDGASLDGEKELRLASKGGAHLLLFDFN